MATSTGVGFGGDIFEGGPTCTDPKDPDSDFIANSLELGPSTDTDKDGTPDYLDTDSDNDTWTDKEEAANPLLDPSQPGQKRDNTCDALADTDLDGIPDVRDLDSDGDGVPDIDEKKYDPDGKLGCRVKIDCDGDGVPDVIEVAAASNPADGKWVPSDATLYFVLPYGAGEKTKDFPFSTGVAKADVYFLVDTTASMQPTIDNLKASLDATIIPEILNGDLNANPPIPAITDANIGIGTFRDIPWAPYGQPGDDVYRNAFNINAQTVLGNVAPPIKNGNSYTAPASVESILGTLSAGGGGDNPEGTLQALWLGGDEPALRCDGRRRLVAGGAVSGHLPGPRHVRRALLPAAVAPGVHPLVGRADAQERTGRSERVRFESGRRHEELSRHGHGAQRNQRQGHRRSNRHRHRGLGARRLHRSRDEDRQPLSRPVFRRRRQAARADGRRRDGQRIERGRSAARPARGRGPCTTSPPPTRTTPARGTSTAPATASPDPAYQNPAVDPDPKPFDASKLIKQITPVPSMSMPLPYASLEDCHHVLRRARRRHGHLPCPREERHGQAAGAARASRGHPRADAFGPDPRREERRAHRLLRHSQIPRSGEVTRASVSMGAASGPNAPHLVEPRMILDDRTT